METARHVNFDKYAEFVDAVTSDASKDFLSLSDRLVALDEKGANIERLLTAAVGINAEGGEFMEIVKKMIFQGSSLIRTVSRLNRTVLEWQILLRSQKIFLYARVTLLLLPFYTVTPVTARHLSLGDSLCMASLK